MIATCVADDDVGGVRDVREQHRSRRRSCSVEPTLAGRGGPPSRSARRAGRGGSTIARRRGIRVRAPDARRRPPRPGRRARRRPARAPGAPPTLRPCSAGSSSRKPSELDQPSSEGAHGLRGLPREAAGADDEQTSGHRGRPRAGRRGGSRPTTVCCSSSVIAWYSGRISGVVGEPLGDGQAACGMPGVGRLPVRRHDAGAGRRRPPRPARRGARCGCSGNPASELDPERLVVRRAPGRVGDRPQPRRRRRAARW